MSEQGYQATAPAECPKCRANVPFRRSLDPVIDSCGFETYTLVCPACGQSVSGIINPTDDTFLAAQVDKPAEIGGGPEPVGEASPPPKRVRFPEELV
jgi:hypothetical protein